MWEIQRLDEDELRAEFGADQRWLRAPGFPGSERDEDGTPRWPADEVWQWLAAQQPDLATRVRLRHWPRGVAKYGGARSITDGVAQDWSVRGVVLRLVWPTVPAFATGRVVAAAFELDPPVPNVVRVRHDFGLRGPSLSVHAETGLLDDREPVWPELALVLGGRAPFWPYGLRDGAAMRRWRPGDPPAAVPAAIGAPDPGPLLRLSGAIPAGESAHTVLLALAQATQHQAGSHVAFDIELVTSNPLMAPWVELAVTSLPFPEPEKVDELVWRDGWLALVARTDTLTHEVLVEVLKSGRTTWLPYSAAEYVDSTSKLGAEWAARLQPTRPYAGFEVLYGHLGPGQENLITDYLTDPATEAPAVRLTSGRLLAAVPHRLPTTSPLASVTLDTPIWVRLADGTVHLAPRRDAPGISWGYRGTGTAILALLIARLLDDIAAPAPERMQGSPAELEELLQTDWPHGTTFTRNELDVVRGQWGAGRP